MLSFACRARVSSIMLTDFVDGDPDALDSVPVRHLLQIEQAHDTLRTPAGWHSGRLGQRTESGA